MELSGKYFMPDFTQTGTEIWKVGHKVIFNLNESITVTTGVTWEEMVKNAPPPANQFF